MHGSAPKLHKSILLCISGLLGFLPCGPRNFLRAGEWSQGIVGLDNCQAERRAEPIKSGMPVKFRSAQREARKKKVVLAFRRKRALTAAEVAAACGWPVAVTTRIIVALVSERRLRVCGEQAVRYSRATKSVAVYSVPVKAAPMLLPEWLRGPPKERR